MTLIKSISGIRGTIGGRPGAGLTPDDVIKFTSAFGTWLLRQSGNKSGRMVIGRDARISGPVVSSLVSATLQSVGIDVIDLGLSTTPTVEVAVPDYKAIGGIIITASHNPREWNALKLLNAKGEFISAADGEEVLEMAESGDVTYVKADKLGSYRFVEDGFIDRHIEKVLALDLVDVNAIRKRKFRIAVDAVNSTGGIAIPKLLNALGVEQVYELYCEPNGLFPHNPEPLPEYLIDLVKLVNKKSADMGIIVDPDVDRLAFVDEEGEVFGEEYTLVAVADYVLSVKPGNTVSNMSSTRALGDVTEKHGGAYYPSAVGEVNVVNRMKEVKAVIGGEGNGGVIYPELHYGRDALVGIALFLTYLAKENVSVSVLKSRYPKYHMSKNKIILTPEMDVDSILEEIVKKYKNFKINREDGVKIDFDDKWVHLRKSNTEPIIRVYTEGEHMATAENLAQKIIADLKEVVHKMIV